MTTRRGGASRSPYDTFNLGLFVGDDPRAVASNRARLAAAAGLPADGIVWMHQVHGTSVQAVSPGAGSDREDRDAVPGVDGIVTRTAGLGLAVLVADCVPILGGDPAAGVIGAVHAGRKGAAGGVALRALDEMTALGARVDAIELLLGPAVCGRCYEVPAAMRDEVEAALPGSASVTDRGTPGLDLRAGLARQLRAAGVAGVAIDARCTLTDPDLFSHRRGSPTGRQAGLIWIDPRG